MPNHIDLDQLGRDAVKAYSKSNPLDGSLIEYQTEYLVELTLIALAEKLAKLIETLEEAIQTMEQFNRR